MQLSKEGTWSWNSCHCNQTRIFAYFKFSQTIEGGGGGVIENSKLGFLQHLEFQLALT